MPYATVDDVQRRLPQVTLTATSKPTLSDTALYIDDVTSELESALDNLGYVIPITGELSLAQMRVLVAYGTAARVFVARAAGTGGDAAYGSAKYYQDLYDNKLKAIADPNNPTELTDAGRTSNAIQKPSDIGRVRMLDDNGDEILPRATMSQRF